MARLAGTPDCCWAATVPESNHPSLTGPAQCDVAIVGLTMALELCEAGKSVIVLEGRQVGRQVTGLCPCHGSIFEAGGEVIHGPAKERLMPRPL